MLLMTCLNQPATAASPGQLWSQHFGDTDGQNARSIATDAFGNIYVTGYFLGSLDFGGGDLTSAGNSDVFLVKFDALGAYQWSRHFGDAAEQNGYAVGTDAAGDVYVGGFFQGTVDFGGGPLTSAGDRDVFLAKFNSAGTHQWSKRFGDASEQRCMSIGVDAAGDVYATGYFLGSVNFGGANLGSTGSYQVFLAGFDSDGVHQWSKQFGDAADQRGTTMTADAYGDVYVAGPFKGTINLGGSSLTSAGDFDIFLAKFDYAGLHAWSKRYGDSESQEPRAVVTDHWGCVYLTGGMLGTTDFGGGPLTSAGGSDAFLAKVDAAGAYQWSHRWGDGADQYGASAATNSWGDVYMAGDFDGTVNLGGGDLTSLGGTDFYLAKFDVSGVYQWSQRYGDSATQEVACIATDASDDMVATGFFQGVVDLGGGPLTASGGFDAFVAKFTTTPTGARATPVTNLPSISAYPNPFNPATTIRYTVPAGGRVTIEVFDPRGARVVTLVDGDKIAGAYSTRWNGRDDRGRPVSSGVYFGRITSPAGARSYKMTLLK